MEEKSTVHIGVYEFVTPVEADGENVKISGKPEQFWTCCMEREENAEGCVSVVLPPEDDRRRCTRCGFYENWAKSGDKCVGSHKNVQMRKEDDEVIIFCSNCKEVLNSKTRKKFNAGSKWQKPSMPKGRLLINNFFFNIYDKVVKRILITSTTRLITTLMICKS